VNCYLTGRYIQQSVLCWLATSNHKNEPNVSPKEIFTCSDDETFLIANVASPISTHNILENANGVPNATSSGSNGTGHKSQYRRDTMEVNKSYRYYLI
jgi:predicted pyridoxine 5'-phosphate oxidase superfamily flavin-nucleotide-binding protein